MSTNGDEVGRRWREEVQRLERRRVRSIEIALAITLALVLPLNIAIGLLLAPGLAVAIALGFLVAVVYVPVRLLVRRRRGV